MAITAKGKAKAAAKAGVKAAAQSTVNRSQSVAGKSANPTGKAYKKVVGGIKKLDTATAAAKSAGLSQGSIKRAINSGKKAGYKAGK